MLVTRLMYFVSKEYRNIFESLLLVADFYWRQSWPRAVVSALRSVLKTSRESGVLASAALLQELAASFTFLSQM